MTLNIKSILIVISICVANVALPADDSENQQLRAFLEIAEKRIANLQLDLAKANLDLAKANQELAQVRHQREQQTQLPPPAYSAENFPQPTPQPSVMPGHYQVVSSAPAIASSSYGPRGPGSPRDQGQLQKNYTQILDGHTFYTPANHKWFKSNDEENTFLLKPINPQTGIADEAKYKAYYDSYDHRWSIENLSTGQFNGISWRPETPQPY